MRGGLYRVCGVCARGGEQGGTQRTWTLSATRAMLLVSPSPPLRKRG